MQWRETVLETVMRVTQDKLVTDVSGAPRESRNYKAERKIILQNSQNMKFTLLKHSLQSLVHFIYVCRIPVLSLVTQVYQLWMGEDSQAG